ncbi:ATP-binding protein [Kitasatospora kifunensis]|uniref:Anti-sigma regulatory factor (Ser/Thr protein kinase) n=1 Tax=Kitasatospora kifunensis TaxID=58351 RepID=A0A7W7R0I7_KITKI|nr:ATP-binding protein [Kitasatospora kifunensis]MBB4923212.1 anti-sigma regulatory factor (Ser/Thr protein kinase) [Kitasatospora kifunensis]
MAATSVELASKSRVLGGSDEFWMPRALSSSGWSRRRLLRLLGRIEGGDRFADSGSVIITELVTNAVKHGTRRGKRVFVRLTVDAASLRIEVHDASSVAPVLRDIELLDECGRGLNLVRAMSQAWGFGPRTPGIGKIVWAVVTPVQGDDR